MTKIKMCGLRRDEDIRAVNRLLPDFVGYVFFEKSKRYITPSTAERFTAMLDRKIIPVGVFVNAPVGDVISLAESGIIKIAQLHGDEDEKYIETLRSRNIEVMKAFIVKSADDVAAAAESTAEHILLDAGMGDGRTFNHALLENFSRPYFLAGGLSCENISAALTLNPFAVDVSSGIETDGFKNSEKMETFINLVRKGR